MSDRRKLLIVGDGECGKTSILSRFMDKEFPESYLPTVFENAIAPIKIGNKIIDLVMWDSAGQEDYDRLRLLCYPDTDVILLCFAVNNIDSFINIVDKWIAEVKNNCPKCPIILVGNKIDLRAENEGSCNFESISRRFVTTFEGEMMASRIGAEAYHECSALKKIGIKEIFYQAGTVALQKNEKSHSCCTIS